MHAQLYVASKLVQQAQNVVAGRVVLRMLDQIVILTVVHVREHHHASLQFRVVDEAEELLVTSGLDVGEGVRQL